jgi:hypothetical protein
MWLREFPSAKKQSLNDLYKPIEDIHDIWARRHLRRPVVSCTQYSTLETSTSCSGPWRPKAKSAPFTSEDTGSQASTAAPSTAPARQSYSATTVRIQRRTRCWNTQGSMAPPEDLIGRACITRINGQLPRSNQARDDDMQATRFEHVYSDMYA